MFCFLDTAYGDASLSENVRYWLSLTVYNILCSELFPI